MPPCIYKRQGYCIIRKAVGNAEVVRQHAETADESCRIQGQRDCHQCVLSIEQATYTSILMTAFETIRIP
jgi:hypothetical protein